MDMDRRKFIARGGTFAALVSVPVLSWSYRQAGEARPAQADESAALLAKLGRPALEVLTLAARAPSGHNTQPWTVRVLDREHWIIGIDGSRRLLAVDPTARETLLSLGAFLENIVVAAAHYGYGVEYEVIAHSPADADVIDLRLRKTAPSPQPLAEISLRRTVRNGHLAGEIKSTDLAAVTGRGEDCHYFPRGTAAAKYLSEGTVEANRQQAFRDPAQEELANWIRWSAGDAARYRNGLTPDSMEIEGLTGWYVSHFYDRASVLSKSFRDTTIKQVIERVGQGGGWLVVSSPGTAIPTLIETGRKVELMWLRLRDRKIAIHPMTQMLEEAPWREQVAKNLGIDGVPQFLLRIGYLVSYPNPMSVRMPPGWIMTYDPRFK
ncbi:MAG: nitroreductase [Acidipila sp.]|nr:nitroreductase [Acidipila sp.]